MTVEEELWVDRVVYGACYWREVEGRKVRIPPQEILIGDDGALIAPHITDTIFAL